jgi:hypothetical protein
MKDFDQFFKNLIEPDKTLYDRIFSKLYRSKSEKSDVYRYIGEANGGELATNIENLFLNQDSVDLSKSDIQKIDSTLGDLVSDQAGRRGFEGKAVIYPKLTNSVNSRFDHCWFLKTDKDRWGNDSGWDICVQKFTDDWYIVNIGDGAGRFSYWFICDEIDGLLELIKDKIINA